MKQIFNGAGIDVTSSTVAFLKQNRNLPMADLYQLVLLMGGQSRNEKGFVARWTDRDYPILSGYLNNFVPEPVRWPTVLGQSGIFYPQKIKRSGIESKVGFTVATLNVEVFANDSLDSALSGLGGPIRPPTSPSDASIPSYRDAFALRTADFFTVAETLKQAAWSGELDAVYFFLYRGFMSEDNGDVDTLGVMPLFTGYVKQFDVTRLSVKFSVASLMDIITTTNTPTQVITNHDRGGDDVVPLSSLPSLVSNTQNGSTTLKLIGDGGPPPSTVEVDGEQHQVPPTGPFTVPVLHSGASFIADIAVVFSDTGLPLAKVGGSPAAGQYAVSGTGVYTFNSADSHRGVAISYTYNAGTDGTLANGILVYNYGAYLQRPAASPVIRLVYTNTFTGGLNQIYLFEPLPISPAVGDTFTVYQPQSFDSAQSVFGKGFPFVPKPESVL